MLYAKTCSTLKSREKIKPGVIRHRTYFDCQLHRASQEDLVCFIQDLITVLDQFVGVPCEEELPLVGLVCSIIRKELGLLRSVIVLPSIIRQIPLRMPSRCCCCFEVCFQVLIIALQFLFYCFSNNCSL